MNCKCQQVHKQTNYKGCEKHNTKRLLCHRGAHKRQRCATSPRPESTHYQQAITLTGGGTAHLTKCPNEKPGAILTRIQFPSAARDFSLKVSFQCSLAYSVLRPCVQLHASTSVCTLTIPNTSNVQKQKYCTHCAEWVEQLLWLLQPHQSKETQISCIRLTEYFITRQTAAAATEKHSCQPT